MIPLRIQAMTIIDWLHCPACFSRPGHRLHYCYRWRWHLGWHRERAFKWKDGAQQL